MEIEIQKYMLYFRAISRAVNNLVPPDKNTSDAVDVRQELDLRIGTRVFFFVYKYSDRFISA